MVPAAGAPMILVRHGQTPDTTFNGKCFIIFLSTHAAQPAAGATNGSACRIARRPELPNFQLCSRRAWPPGQCRTVHRPTAPPVRSSISWWKTSGGPVNRFPRPHGVLMTSHAPRDLAIRMYRRMNMPAYLFSRFTISPEKNSRARAHGTYPRSEVGNTHEEWREKRFTRGRI